MADKRVLVVGGDGYCGWATALHLSSLGYSVAIADNMIRRHWDATHGIETLTPIAPIERRLAAWQRLSGATIQLFPIDIGIYEHLAAAIAAFKPDAIVHFGEQRSAPFSMIDREHAVATQTGNVTGTLNILFAMRDLAPNAHLVKLGTMGEYGQPNIDIEEGYIEIQHNGRTDILPFPKQAGSFYHLSKVHDSDNIAFAARIWGLRATDLNQGVVYGNTAETLGDPALLNRFDYDGLFGTVLNRFCVEAVAGHPLTVYGSGGQTRAFIDLRDTVACIALSIANPPDPGRLQVFNQFTETFSVLELAERVERVARARGIAATIEHGENPRIEREAHYYHANNTSLLALGLQPHHLDDRTIDAMLDLAVMYRERIALHQIAPTVQWAPPAKSRRPQHVRLVRRTSIGHQQGKMASG
jgi:UDP-sulfoquinovose synthase